MKTVLGTVQVAFRVSDDVAESMLKDDSLFNLELPLIQVELHKLVGNPPVNQIVPAKFTGYETTAIEVSDGA